MKRMVLFGFLAVALVVSGCATSGDGLTDEERVRQTLDQWSTGLIEHDLDKFMATISESFSAPQAPDKETLGDFIAQAIDAGYIDEAEIIIDDAQFTIDGDKCSVYPVDLMSVAGSVAVELVFAKEECKWLVVGMEVDGM